MESHTKCLVTNIQRYSLNDGPGIRTTVFVKGCRLSCPWCHNPECISFDQDIYFDQNKCQQCGHCTRICPERACGLELAGRIDRSKCSKCFKCILECPYKALVLVGKWITPEEAFREVARDALFYGNSKGGITISGGEPLEHPDFCVELLRKCKALGFHTALDTTGFAPWAVVQEVARYVDLFLYDVKHLDPDVHEATVGVSNERILENLESLILAGRKVRIRIPLIPSFNYDYPNIQAFVNLACKLKRVDGVDLLPYHRYAQRKYEMLGRPYPLNGVEEVSKEQARQYAKLFEEMGVNVTVGG